MPCVKKARMPKWVTGRGWTGGDAMALYTVTNTAGTFVSRGGKRYLRGIPIWSDIRLATRDEAKKYWSDNLWSGWKVACKQ